MTAAEHARVWSNVAVRCNKLAEEAERAGAEKAETVQLGLAVFAQTIANAYRDNATVFQR